MWPVGKKWWHSIGTTAQQATTVWACVAKKDDDWMKKCVEYEVERPTPRGRPKRAWREVVREDCHAHKLNTQDAMNRSKWRNLIKDVRSPGWVWVCECFFWYQPTQVVPDQQPLNGCVLCVCVFADLSEVLWARVHGASLSVPGRCCLSMFTDTEGRDCQADQSTHRRTHVSNRYIIHTHTRLTALCPGLPGWAGTRKVKPIWILLKQETMSGSGISWAICKSAHRSRQITMPAPHHSVFYRPDALPVAQPAVSKHWRQQALKAVGI